MNHTVKIRQQKQQIVKIKEVVKVIGTGEDPTFYLDNVIYVSKNGDDTTGTRGIVNKPFLTIEAARDEAESGDLIIVFPGTYNDSNLLKDGIFYFMHEGVTITGDDSVTPSHTGAIKCSITGYAEFISSGNIVHIFESQYNGLDLLLQCNRIESTTSGNAVLLRIECKARIEVRDVIKSSFYTLDFRNAEMDVVIKARDIQLHNTTNPNFYNISTDSLPSTATIDIDIETLTQKTGTDTSGPLVMVVNNNAYVKLTVRNPVVDTRPVGQVIHLDGGFIDIDIDVETTDIPFLYVGNWHNAVRKILLKGRYVCLGSNAINIDVTKVLTLDLRDCYIKSSNKGITSTVSNNNLTAILRNVTIDSVEESIYSTQVVDINVERDFHYTTEPNENVTLITSFKKFPEVLPDNKTIIGTGTKDDPFTVVKEVIFGEEDIDATYTIQEEDVFTIVKLNSVTDVDITLDNIGVGQYLSLRKANAGGANFITNDTQRINNHDVDEDLLLEGDVILITRLEDVAGIEVYEILESNYP